MDALLNMYYKNTIATNLALKLKYSGLLPFSTK